MHSAYKYMTYSSSNNVNVHGEKCTSPALLPHLHHTHSQKSPTNYAIHNEHLISKVHEYNNNGDADVRMAYSVLPNGNYAAFLNVTNSMQKQKIKPFHAFLTCHTRRIKIYSVAEAKNNHAQLPTRLTFSLHKYY